MKPSWNFMDLARAARSLPDNNLDTLGARLHNETDDTVSGTADSQAVEQLVAQRLALSDGRQTTLGHTLSKDGESAGVHVETLLQKRGQLADAATVLTKNSLGVGSTDNNLRLGRGLADLDTGVSLLRELTSEELVQLGVEDTVGDVLALLGNLLALLDVGGHRDWIVTWVGRLIIEWESPADSPIFKP